MDTNEVVRATIIWSLEETLKKKDAEIERLREQVEFEKKCRNDAFDELKKQDAEIEQLRESLAFMT